jgi:hypothetical protein
MIFLKYDIQYFMLQDMQGNDWNANTIFEGIEEVAEKFISYAESDEMANNTLKGWSIQQMLEHWQFEATMLDYSTQSWKPLIGSYELNYIHNK